VIEGDPLLQALPGDVVRIEYVDAVNITEASRQLSASAVCIEGSLGDVRVAKAQISDEDLRLRTQLKTAKALTQIGNHYKEFGLEDPARVKFQEALQVAEEATARASEIESLVLEQCYVQLWEIYFALDDLRLAVAMSQRLMREFPESAFIDDAMLKQAEIARKQGTFKDAIALYGSLLKLKASDLRDEAQFGIAECYEKMAEATTGSRAQSLFERAFENYQKVYEQFPESGRVGDAVARAANYFYQRQDYQRAIDVFEGVIANHPDANYLDVIYFNYGRCLYRTDRKRVARQQFDLLVLEFPESKLATEAKRISDALVKAGF
ncbi:MAG: tetratricopeptide repeat protein, partial [Verrucomicrobiales bacterium]|nr:tetratricopeptide repeat protein [Verrucomicrobiales bacterium]